MLAAGGGVLWGNPDVKTPNLDRLQREGIHLTRRYAGLLSDAAFLDGARPSRTASFLNDVPLNPEAVTIAGAGAAATIPRILASGM